MSITRVTDPEELEELLHLVAIKLRIHHHEGRWHGKMSLSPKMLAVEFTNTRHPSMQNPSN